MFSVVRFNAIVSKEFKDALKNTNAFLIFLLPLIFGFIFSIIMPKEQAHVASTFAVYFAAVQCGIYVPAMLLAEEKEKNTLRVLMLSPAKPLEVLAGKCFITWLMITLISIAITFVTGTGMGNILIFLLALWLLVAFTMSLGLIVGLLAPNMMATGAIGLPLQLLFLLVPMFQGSDSKLVQRLLKILPPYHGGEALVKNFMGNSINQIAPNLMLLTVGVLVAVLLLGLTYKKKGLQD